MSVNRLQLYGNRAAALAASVRDGLVTQRRCCLSPRGQLLLTVRIQKKYRATSRIAALFDCHDTGILV